MSSEGAASFEAPDWKCVVFPFDFSLTAPKLFHGDGLHLLRGEDGEIGFSFDKNSSRHFFFLGKAPSFPKFSLGLKLDGSRAEFHKDTGVLAIYDKSGKLRLVYSAPVVRHPSGKTINLNLEWDPTSSSIHVPLPDLAFPLVIAFGVGIKIPDVKGGFHFGFPSFKFGEKGEIEDSSSSESEDDEKTGKGKKSRGFDLDIKAPKIGFGFGGKGEKKTGEVDIEKPDVSGKVKGKGKAKGKVYT